MSAPSGVSALGAVSAKGGVPAGGVPAQVGLPAGEVYLPRGVYLLGVYLPWGGYLPRYNPPVNRMTDRCKNSTLPQTSFACGNK